VVSGDHAHMLDIGHR